MNVTKPKYELVRERLESAIASGEFKLGEQIPAERDLSIRYSVSYMTVRRAISDLVNENVLERRDRRGTFVRSPLHRQKADVEAQTLNLITVTYEGGLHRDFLRLGTSWAEKEGWYPNIVRLGKQEEEPAVRALRKGYSLLFLEEILPNSALGIAVRRASDRAVIVGQVMSSWGVTSVHYDVRRAVEMAVTLLRAAGHVDIGFVVQYPADPNNEMKVAAWEDMMAERFSPEEIDDRRLYVRTERFQSPLEDTVRVIKDYLGKRRHTTAFLTGGEEVALGVLAGCRESGLPVPQSVSLINVGDSSPLVRYSNPAVTCIDANLEPQLKCAIDLLKAGRSGQSEEMLRHIVQPRLIEGASVVSRPHRP